jgi:DNA-binding beta-propeller fold protein YncE
MNAAPRARRTGPIGAGPGPRNEGAWRRRLFRAIPLLGFAIPAAGGVAAQGTPPSSRNPQPATGSYLVLVASEAVDQIASVRFDPDAGTANLERTVPVGINLTDPDGPHGLGASPDGRTFYVSTAHGVPFGSLWKFDAATGNPAGQVELGNFPASLQVSPDGIYVFVVNFNLHGEMVPSSVSVVSTDPFVEVARIPTCTMPHGSRLNPQGTRHYSACMMDDMLIEIDAHTLSVSRHFMLARGGEHGMTGPPRHRAMTGGHADPGGHGMDAPKPGDVSCSPTWAQPSADGRTVFVACNKSNEIVEVDVDGWTLRRRFPAGDGVYNLAVTKDGKHLIATNKRGRSVSVFDAATGRELGRIATQRRVVHGIAVSPDDRYAFVSVEGVGSEPGTVEMIDLGSLRRVASADVGQMAGGIDVLPAVRPDR